MASPRVSLSVDDANLRAALHRLRAELKIPEGFDPDVAAAAERAAAAPPSGGADRHDRRDLDLLTIDPPGARDLDQAFGARRARGETIEVSYAIADVGAFVAPGSLLDAEARRRGATMYAPDARAPLHPPVLNEDSASLLPGCERLALLWTFAVGGDGTVASSRVERATVRSRAQLSYAQAQTEIDGGSGREALVLLREVGRRRLALEAARGAVSLELPEQHVVARNGSYALEYEQSLPIETWNAQISLMTGMAAAGIMLDGNIGLLRTMRPPTDHAMKTLRSTARALRIEWPASMPYPERVRTLDRQHPNARFFLIQAARSSGSAGYTAFAGERPKVFEHFAIAAPYAHVTAPLRRLVDRFANEIVHDVFHGRPVPEWVTAALEQIPSLAARAATRQRSLEREANNLLEAATLAARVGETFHATVIDVDRDGVHFQIEEPAIVADCDVDARTRVTIGHPVRVRLVAADVARRKVSFALAGA